MASAGTVNVNLIARTAAFEAGMKKAQGLVSGFGSSLNLIKGVAAGFLAWKGTQFVAGMMQSIDATAKLADRLGTSTEALVGLQHAGDLAGVSTEQIATNMEKMTRNLAEAERGSKPVNEALARMGMTISDLRGLQPDQQLGKIADGLNSVAGAGQRADAAVDIFGKSGIGMVNMLSDGSKGLADARKEAEALGLTFSRLEAFKVEQANDAMTRLGATLKGGLVRAAIELSPIVEAIATKFIESAKNAGGFGAIATSVMDKVKTGVGIVGNAWSVLLAAWDAGRVALNMIGAAWAKTGDGAYRAIQYISGLWQNWVQLVQDTTAYLGDSMASTWARMKVPVAEFVQYVGGQMASMLETSANAVRRLDGDLADSLAASAGAVRAGVGTMAANASRDATAALEKVTSAGDQMRASWANLFNVETTGSPMLQQLSDGFIAAGETAAVDFSASFAAVINQDASEAVEGWFAQIDALSQASAEASAERVAARMKQDEEAAAAQRDAAAANEDWITQLTGQQAEKRLKWEKQTLDQRLDYASNIFGNLATLQNTTSRRMFEIGKIAAYGQAIVSTAAGIVRQFADLPIYAAIPAAAAVAVAGAVQIASIASTSFGGGGSVSSSGGSIPLVNGEPQGAQMGADSNFATTNARTVQEIRVTGLPDDIMLSGRAARGLLQQLIDTARDGGGTLVYDMSAA